jgi:transcriptional regulator with XRE-family HTH domain
MTPHRDVAQALAGSAVPRRVLGQQLRDLRQQAGFTVKTAATLMEWSEPKMWRIETGQTAMRAMDVEAMCAVYSAPPDLTRALTGLARQTKAHGWWHSYSDAPSENFGIYATLEATASGLLDYAFCQVPALLRTEAYARTLIASSHPGTADTSQLVRDCLARQMLVLRANAPLSATVVLNEALLRCPVGGPAVMAGQLWHLAEIAALPNICLRVLPFTAGLHPGLTTGPFTLLQFPATYGPEADTTIVHTSGLTGELFLDKPHEIRQYSDAHTTIFDCSLDEAATKDLLRTAAKELDQYVSP